MSNPIKVINHVGFISDLRAAHKGFGPCKLRARNPNRKQFYPEKNRRVSWDNGLTIKFIRKSKFQQDLPKEFATYFAFYGNETVLKSVINIYKNKGVKILYTA